MGRCYTRFSKNRWFDQMQFRSDRLHPGKETSTWGEKLPFITYTRHCSKSNTRKSPEVLWKSYLNLSSQNLIITITVFCSCFVCWVLPSFLNHRQVHWLNVAEEIGLDWPSEKSSNGLLHEAHVLFMTYLTILLELKKKNKVVGEHGMSRYQWSPCFMLLYMCHSSRTTEDTVSSPLGLAAWWLYTDPGGSPGWSSASPLPSHVQPPAPPPTALRWGAGRPGLGLRLPPPSPALLSEAATTVHAARPPRAARGPSCASPTFIFLFLMELSQNTFLPSQKRKTHASLYIQRKKILLHHTRKGTRSSPETDPKSNLKKT